MTWITVAVGTDVYGAVRKVDNTPVVTKFAMLQFLPIFPIESYYLSRLGPQSHVGIPLILGQTSQGIVGLRLARIDRLSASIAYPRAIGAAIALFGFTGVILAIVTSFSLPRNENDPFQRYLLPACGLILATGVVIAAPTYYFTYVVPQRDKLIRQNCGDVLGIAADPANVDSTTARELLRMTREALAQTGITEPKRVIRNPSLTDADQKRLLLVLVRVMIAIKGRRDELEPLADSLLLELTGASSATG